MGLTFSSKNYKLVHIYQQPSKMYCCSFGNYEYLFNDDNSYFIFQKKTDKKSEWIFYNGHIKDIMNSLCNQYFINEDLLLKKGKTFDIFYNMVSHIDTLNDDQFKNSIISYQKQNIQKDYIDNII